MKLEVDDDIRGYVQALTETYIHDGLPTQETERTLKELKANGMTDGQWKRIAEVMRRMNTNRTIGGIAEIHKGGRLTELFDVKKALISKNKDAEKLLQQYEDRLRKEGISQDK